VALKQRFRYNQIRQRFL